MGSRAQRLQEQLTQTEAQVKQARELNRVEEEKLRGAYSFAKSESDMASAAQVELRRKSEELESVKAQLLQTQRVARQAMASERNVEGRLRQVEALEAQARREKSDTEQRALLELRRA